MALPTIATPIYTIEIPSTKKPFKFRPFLVRDEKALLVAQESEDVGVMLDTVKEVIKSCAKSDIDVDALPSVDIEYIFLQIRAKSIGEMVQLLFACDMPHTPEEAAKAQVLVDINIEDIKVETFDEHNPKIVLFNDIGVMMKEPTFKTLKKIETSDPDDADAMFDVIIDCIDYVYDAEGVYPAKDQKREELVKFLEDLTTPQLEKLEKFLQTLPQIRAYINYTCPVCGTPHNKYLEGLASFF